jgi:hypothetical protein
MLFHIFSTQQLYILYYFKMHAQYLTSCAHIKTRNDIVICRILGCLSKYIHIITLKTKLIKFNIPTVN